MTWSHVTGPVAGSRPARAAADLRYHSSWELAQNGAATSRPFQVAASTGPLSTPAVNPAASAVVNGRRKPASANSATNGGSRLMRAIERSLAARRRTSCSRCPEALLGSVETVIRYRPPDAAVQAAASSACPPLSGLTYHPGPVGQGPGDGPPLLLPARQLRRQVPGPVGQPDQVEQLGDPAAALRPGRTPRGRLVKRPSAGGGQGALHVLGRRQGGDEVE